MKITKGDEIQITRLPAYGVTLELSPLEAARLVDVCGVNISIPEHLAGCDTKAREQVESFLGEIFRELNRLGFSRPMANWGKD